MGNVSNSKFRLERFSYFLAVLDRIEHHDRALRILDVGGEEAYWFDKIPLIKKPVQITLLNLERIEPSLPCIESVAGNACSMKEFEDNSFDIVHSNSVVEHVGRWRDMKAMADEVRRLAPRYFVQTPYFWFPIEPHFRSLGFHWLPEPVRAKRLMSRKHGLVPRAQNLHTAMSAVQETVLLDRAMLAALFPDAKIIFEKFLGLRKSLMAVRDP
jgi:hypothetical protein